MLITLLLSALPELLHPVQPPVGMIAGDLDTIVDALKDAFYLERREARMLVVTADLFAAYPSEDLRMRVRWELPVKSERISQKDAVWRDEITLGADAPKEASAEVTIEPPTKLETTLLTCRSNDSRPFGTGSVSITACQENAVVLAAT